MGGDDHRGAIRVTIVAKPTGGVRRLTRLPPRDGRDYAVMVAAIVDRVEAALRPDVVANRAAGGSTTTVLALQPWTGARRRLFRRAAALAADAGAIAVADVAECFATIRPREVERSLRGVGARAVDVRTLRGFLEGLEERGVRGLPIGPPASAVLANAVLAGADDALARVGVRFVRWVDDVLIFARDARGARSALSRLEEALGASGLRTNPRKTRLHDAPSHEATALRPSAAPIIARCARSTGRPVSTPSPSRPPGSGC